MQSEVPRAPGDEPASPVAEQAHLPILGGRLHPITVLFSVYASMRRLVIPMIPLVLFQNKAITVSIIGLLIASAIVRAVVRYLTFSYRLEGGELITRQGILERTERHVPLERVQEIRIEQGVLQRLFGVVEATVETAGGQGPEASLSVLSRAEAERLRQAVFATVRARVAREHISDSGLQTAPAREVMRRLRLSELVLAGVTSNHLLSALALVGAVWAFIDDYVPESVNVQIERVVGEEASRLVSGGTGTAVLVALAAISLLFLASMLLSVIGSVVLFYGFTLSRAGEDLHRTYGLLTRRASSLPRRRIQVLEIKEGALRRLFKLATLRADTAGSVTNESRQRRGGRDVLLPVLPRHELMSLLPAVFPDFEPSIDWTPVSKLAILRGTLKGWLVCAIGAAVSFGYQASAIGLWPLAFLPVIYGVNLMRYHNLGYVLGERYFQTRRGWLSRSTHIVPIRNAQAFVLRRSPIDRWLGLATLLVDSAGQAYTGGGPQIANLPVHEARLLARRLAHCAAATRYRW
jgi:putative membrane protein